MTPNLVNKTVKLPDTKKVADHQYQPVDYINPSQVEQGTAETHEQVSDVYMTGNNPDA